MIFRKDKVMNLDDLFAEIFLLEEKGKNLLLLDLDDTLVKAKNIFIYRKLPTDKNEVKLTPEQYANEKISSETKQCYDYRDFRNPDAVAKSIITGLPIIPNLKIMDDYIKNGWKIGILTARGMEEVIFKTLKAWLMFKDSKGNLQKIGDKLVRNLVNAINDDKKHYKGLTDFEKKANIVKKLANQYDRIMFLDDDLKNIDAIKNLDIKNIYVKLARK